MREHQIYAEVAQSVERVVEGHRVGSANLSLGTKIEKESKMIDIKEAVKNNKQVRFTYYRDSSLWYLTESDELFPVPIEDIGNATFKNEDKAILFMRYMRKWNDNIKAQ